ncbi:MAG: TRIC cation channel family protein, partial [Rothia sp. (in: high G+C Gram-positive bacteria)]|nr:TRIC cation channel family protein [Rothia sp. (in: high G+C Gram-positive bacteria)]
MESWDPTLFFRVVDVSAVVANGLLGGAVARAFRFDVVGFILLAVLSGMGGGLIRDVLLGIGFPVALTDSSYWIGAIVAATLAYILDLGSQWASRVLVVVDFLGMGCWAATGTIKALGSGLHWLPAIALGITTAVGGGVLRDIMV